jgi:predicted amidophosphoribosyltransferase
VRWRARLAAKRLGAARRRARRGTFAVRGRIESRRVLLVDDVMTTGSSLDACARALLAAGAAEVRALVWARRL